MELWKVLVFISCLSSVSLGAQGKYIIVTKPRAVPHGLFRIAILHYPRFRDFHKGSDKLMSHLLWYFPTLVFVNIIAEHANATVIEEDKHCATNAKDCGAKSGHKYPWIWPAVRMLDNSMVKTTIFSTWSQYQNSKNITTPPEKIWNPSKVRKEMPTFLLIKVEFFNFYYCNVQTRLVVSPWTLSLFTDPFKVKTWIVWSVSFISVTTLLIINDSKNGAGSIILLLFSATLQIGSNEFSTKSGLYLVWLEMSMLLEFFYSGEITSTLISPPRDDIMSTFQDLRERQYALLTRNSVSAGVWNTTAQLMKPNSKVRKNLEFFLENLVHLSPNFDERNYFHENGFVLRSWVYALEKVQKGNLDIQRKAKNDMERARRCHLGQELVNFDETFFVTTPPGNTELARSFQLLFQTGIGKRFVDEIEGAIYSERVQDRVRVVSHTKVREREGVTFVRLTIGAKMVTVFLLWIFCLAATLLSFIGEMISFMLINMNCACPKNNQVNVSEKRAEQDNSNVIFVSCYSQKDPLKGTVIRKSRMKDRTIIVI